MPPFSEPARPRERARLLAGLSRPAEEAARFLLGHVLVRRRGRRAQAVRIVETEAYLGEDDPAAHAFHGRTKRTAPLWGPPGTVYVYFVYGMHHCLNVSVEKEGVAGCVLIRAAEPLEGSGLGLGDCRGPGRLCRALGLDTGWSGRHLFETEAALFLREGRGPRRIGVSPRIGIRHATDRLLRFFDPESAAVSGSIRQRGAMSAGVPSRVRRERADGHRAAGRRLV